MAPAASQLQRVRVDGKFFRLGAQKFCVKGVAYGPFAPNSEHEPFASYSQTVRDFELISELGANVVRIYEVPPRWFLDLAASSKLKVLLDIPWNKHLCFLDAPEAKQAAREAVRAAVRACAAHPALFAFSIANEIPPDVVRWSGSAAGSATTCGPCSARCQSRLASWFHSFHCANSQPMNISFWPGWAYMLP